MDAVMAYLPEPHPSGWRLYVVLTRGRKWITLMDVGHLRRAMVPLIEEHGFVDADVSERRVRSRIRGTQKQFNRMGINYSRVCVREALK